MQNFYRPNVEVDQLGMQSDVLSHLRNVREQEKTYLHSRFLIIHSQRKRKLTCNKKKTSLISIKEHINASCI